MPKVRIVCNLEYTIDVEEDDVEMFFEGFHTITEIPEEVILDEAWLYPADGEEINGNDLILERTN